MDRILCDLANAGMSTAPQSITYFRLFARLCAQAGSFFAQNKRCASQWCLSIDMIYVLRFRHGLEEKLISLRVLPRIGFFAYIAKYTALTHRPVHFSES